MIKGALNAFHNTNGGFLDKLSSSQSIRSLLEAAKDGGLSKLLEETVERVFLISYPDSVNKNSLPKITFLGFDMSNAGEIGFIYRRIQSGDFKFTRLVVDIGANDGLISSNSFNLIQLGWSAILVEPVPSQMDLAKMNTYRFVDSNPNYQNITYVQAAIGSKDGSTNFVVTDDLGTMQNHFASQHNYASVGHKMTIPVQTITVQTLVTQYHIPKHFGVLSIDAEGTGDAILHQFIKLGYRPAYIIYEALHNKEPIEYTARYLKKNGYLGLTKRGWNFIFEYKYKNVSD